MKWREARDCGYAEYMARRLISSGLYYRGYRKLRPDTPFFAPGAVGVLAGLVTPETRVFEWGSGASTVWLGRRARRVVSVEHDPEWFDRTKGSIADAGLDNVELLLVPPRDLPDGFSWVDDWEHYEVLGHPPRKHQFLDYVRAIDAYADASFECIVIDGRERIGCLVHARRKLAPHGHLVFDDSARPKYRELADLMAGWRSKRYDFGLLQTSVFWRDGARLR